MSKRNMKVLYTCEYCKREFNPYYCGDKAKKHFCSKECYKAWQLELKRKSKEKECPWYGSYFVPNGEEKYCCEECKKEYAKCYYGSSGVSPARRNALDDVAKEANDLHISYGKMVANRNSKIEHKTEWSIKELADGTHIKIKIER